MRIHSSPEGDHDQKKQQEEDGGGAQTSGGGLEANTRREAIGSLRGAAGGHRNAMVRGQASNRQVMTAARAAGAGGGVSGRSQC